MIRRAPLWTLAALALAACSFPQAEPGLAEKLRAADPAAFTCCHDPERFYPEAAMKQALALASSDAGRAGVEAYFADNTENPRPFRETGLSPHIDTLMAHIRPFDMVFTAKHIFPLGYLVPGRFSHDLIYLGTEAELRAAGFWTLPEVVPHHADIRAGKTFIEAFPPYTRLVMPERALGVDGVAILRPDLTAGQRRAAARAAFGAIGLPYDLSFSADTPDAIVCTELVNLAYPHLGLTVREAYGQNVILPDDVVAQAIRGQGMRVVGYAVTTDEPEAGQSFAWRNIPSLMGDIAAYWGLAPAPEPASEEGL